MMNDFVTENTLRYGQIVRATNGVYVLWDLATNKGVSTSIEPKKLNYKGSLVGYNIGEIIKFHRKDGKVTPTKWNLSEKELPEGIKPLIGVTVDTPPPSPNDGISSSKDFNKKKSARA